MSLVKVIMASATVATTLFTGVAPNTPAADFSTGQYAVAPIKNEVFMTNAEIYDAICAALTESFDSGEPALARYFSAADIFKGKAILPEHSISAKMNGGPKTTITDAGNEIKADKNSDNRVMENSSAGNNAAAGFVVNNNLAETMAGADNKVNEPAPVSSEESLENIVANSSANVAANTSDSSTASREVNADSNIPAPAPVVPANNPADAGSSNTPAPAPVIPANNPADAGSSNTPAPAPAAPASDPVDIGSSDTPAPAPAVPASDPADAGGSNTPAPVPAVSADNGPKYDHTTSIYTNDESTLLRVEYYDENNKLFEYSSVDNYNKDTNSYTETVYRWDDESNTQIIVRTDTYENGALTSSDTP